MKKRFVKKPELLAPAGDLQRAKTAILYGADAVYLGGKSFSLRSRASNFTMEDIHEVCAFAKEHGAHVHVTVNIIPHEEDFEGLKEYLQQLEQAGVTAIIVASPAIMSIARQYAPKLQIHCSTQMSITNTETARFLYETLHVDRTVLARECSMEEVRQITEVCPVETEAFIHGGMCVNYSGRCTLSNRMTLRDANRGGCAQSCRWSYHLYQDNTEITTDTTRFTMGSKDMMTTSWIASLMEAGVSSLKIEGRMKTEYYVASIVSGYRHLIDELYAAQNDLSPERFAYHEMEIMKGENREVCPGFYDHRLQEDSVIFYENSNSHVNHDFLGTVQSYDGETAWIQTRNAFDTLETVEVLSPGRENRTFQIQWIRNKKEELLESSRSPMVLVQLPVPFDVQTGDILRRATKSQILD